MKKELATRALDEAFVAHTGALFKDYAESYQDGDDSSRKAFREKFHQSKAAYDTAATDLEVTEPAHVASGPEDDAAYRMRLGSHRGNRAGKARWELANMSGAELDSYGVQIGLPRGIAQWNPPVS